MENSIGRPNGGSISSSPNRGVDPPPAGIAKQQNLREADAQALKIAAQLVAAVAEPQPNASDHEIDLSLSHIIDAVDFKTSFGRDGGTVRNVMSFAQGYAAGMIKSGENGVITAAEIIELIRGRDYLTIIVGEGAAARSIVFMNDAVDKNKPGALQISREGGEFEVWVENVTPSLDRGESSVLRAEGLDASSRIVLHAQTHIETFVKPPNDPNVALNPPFFHQRQNGPNEPMRRANTCGLHAVNQALGSPVFDHRSWDKAIVGLREAEAITIGESPETVKDKFRLNNHGNNNAFDLHTGVSAQEIFITLKGCIKNNSIACSKVDGYGASLDQPARVIPDVVKNINPAVNSLILGTGDHFVTFRRSEQTKEWWLIDSMQKDQVQQSPQDYLKAKLENGTHIANVSLLALYPPSVQVPYAAVNRHPQEPPLEANPANAGVSTASKKAIGGNPTPPEPPPLLSLRQKARVVNPKPLPVIAAPNVQPSHLPLGNGPVNLGPRRRVELPSQRQAREELAASVRPAPPEQANPFAKAREAIKAIEAGTTKTYDELQQERLKKGVAERVQARALAEISNSRNPEIAKANAQLQMANIGSNINASFGKLPANTSREVSIQHFVRDCLQGAHRSSTPEFLGVARTNHVTRTTELRKLEQNTNGFVVFNPQDQSFHTFVKQIDAFIHYSRNPNSNQESPSQYMQSMEKNNETIAYRILPIQ